MSATDQYSTTSYQYDDANRLTSVDGVPYTWDNNGNLLDDGVNSYTYDFANRLISVTGPSGTSTYAYNGLGDRLQETVNGITTTFTLDLASGLTQVLDDGTNTYLYGNGRIAQENVTPGTGTLDTEYFLGDALGSVRQLTDASGAAFKQLYEKGYGEPGWAYEIAQYIVNYGDPYSPNKPVGAGNVQSLEEAKYFLGVYEEFGKWSTDPLGVYYMWGSGVNSVPSRPQERDMIMLTDGQIKHHCRPTGPWPCGT